MQPNEIRSKLISLLTAIAPDVEPQAIDPDRDLRDQFDFDSMDALHFAQAVSREFGIDVAEKDYPRLTSLHGAGELVQAALAARSPAPGG